MRLLQIYNQYRSQFGGEETIVRQIANLAETNGNETRLLLRSSRGLEGSLSGKPRAFLFGIYNPAAGRAVRRVIQDYRPDVAHVHNLYPLFSPSVLVALRRAGIPTVMTVHNHFLTCPRTDHLYRGRICERCLGGREFNCVLQNCRGNIMESLGYALRAATARKLKLYVDNVTIVIALSEFSARRIVQAGFDPRRVVVLPNATSTSRPTANPARGQYAMFAGRMSPEKGVPTLLEAARKLPDIHVRLAGDGSALAEYEAAAPANVTFLGQLGAEQMAQAYRGARFLVVPSTCFEGCPLVISEGMAFGLPIIASRIGGLPEFVDDGATGLLFEPGNVHELADRMRTLWLDPEACRRLGEAGRRKAVSEYAEAAYWARLLEIYGDAITYGRPNASRPHLG